MGTINDVNLRHYNILCKRAPFGYYPNLQPTLSKTEANSDWHQPSVLEKCPTYREFRYSKMTEKGCTGTSPSCSSYRVVRLTDVAVKRELALFRNNVGLKFFSIKLIQEHRADYRQYSRVSFSAGVRLLLFLIDKKFTILVYCIEFKCYQWCVS